ncbi:MAG: hypothetical protein AAGF91_05915 [Actinomycetota bacterium]
MNDIDPAADRELSNAANALVRETAASITPADVDGALDAVRSASAQGRGSVRASTVVAMEAESGAGRSRTPVLLAVAALVIALVAGGLVLAFAGDDPGSVVTDDPTIPTESVDAVDDDRRPETTEVVGPEPDPESSAAPTTPPADPVGPDAEAQPIVVSSADPPPLLVPDPSMSLSSTVPLEVDPVTETIEVSIADGVIGVYQEAAGEDPDRSLSIVRYELGAGYEADIDRIELEVRLQNHILGPGAVAYGLGDVLPFEEGDSMPTPLQLHAYALAGEVGGVQATELLDTNVWLELPPGVLGHGPDGVVARSRQPGDTLMGYVANDGAPLEWDGPDIPVVTTQYSLSVVRNRSAVSVAGGPTWLLDIERDPSNTRYTEPSPAGPTSGGRILYHERIGQNLTPDVDFGANALPALAVLEADGSGTWYRLPEEWDVAATDVWGTVLMRVDESAGVIELALLDDVLPTVEVVDGSSDPGEPAGALDGIPYRCVDGVRCTQVRAATDGRLVAYSPADGVFEIYDPDTTSVSSVVPVPTELASVSAFLWEVGPDDVAYLMAPTPGAGDPLSDIWAVPLAGERAGQGIAIAESIPFNGDSTFVPAVDGLADVACCGPERMRPDPDDPVYGWVDGEGQPITYDRATFRVELSLGLADVTPRLVRTELDGSETAWVLPHIARLARDVPYVVPTDDGGALMLVAESGDSGRWIARFRPGVGEIDGADLFHLDGDWFPLTLLADGRVLMLDDEADRLVIRTLDEAGDRGVADGLFVNLIEDGPSSVVAPGLNEFITSEQPTWAESLDSLGVVLLPGSVFGERLSITSDVSTATLFLTIDGLLDDSVAATRLTIDTERAADGLLRFVSGSQSQRCQPGRGHQDFRSDPCL